MSHNIDDADIKALSVHEMPIISSRISFKFSIRVLMFPRKKICFAKALFSCSNKFNTQLELL